MAASVFALGLMPALALAAGELDQGFSEDGYVTAVIEDGTWASGVAIQDDGVIVVGGAAYLPPDELAALAAFNPDGTFDDGFIGGGIDLAITPEPQFWIAGIAIDGDSGRIIAVGQLEGGPVAVARFHPDGLIDESFGDDGIAVVGELDADVPMFHGLAIDSQGRILVSSTVSSGLDSMLGVGRLTPDGFMDESFGADGIVTLDLNVDATPRGDSEAGDIAVDGSDRPIITGRSAADLVVVRLTESGNLDPTFSGDGVVFVEPTGGQDAREINWGWDVSVSPDGMIYSVGQVWTTPVKALAVAIDGDGHLAAGFGDGGVASFEFSTDVFLYAADIDAGGGLVAAGYQSTDGLFEDVALVRFAPDGSLDSSFGDGGMAHGPPGAEVQYATDVAVGPDGSIVVVGERDGELLVARYEGSGVPAGTTTTTGATSTTTGSTSTTYPATPSTTVRVTPTTSVGPEDPPVEVPHADRFSDDDGTVFESDIEWLATSGITAGCNPPVNTRFCPEDPVTRGQMAAFLARGMGLSTSGSFEFSDDHDSVFEGDIEMLAEAGITLGCNPPANTRFCPENPVTRGQMAAFLVRALGLTATGTPEFSDDDGSVFESDIERLAEAGITVGCNPPANTRFCPDQPVTRGQMAAFLHRALTG